MPLIIGQTNLDADQLVFFKGQLEHMLPKSFDVKYPNLTANQVFPVDNSAGPGADSVSYDQFDEVGVCKFIADYADDLPRSDVKGKKFSIMIQSLGGSFGYSMQEIRSAAMARRNLSAARAASARRSNDNYADKIVWQADGSATWAGLTGILFHPNVTKAAVSHGNWATATADEMIKDVNVAINSVETLTNGVEAVDTVALPLAMYGLLRTTPRTSNSERTCLEFLKATWPGVTFIAIPALKTAKNPRTGAIASTNCMLCYRRSPDHLTIQIPVIYEQFAAQERNLAFVVPTHSRHGGMNITYPLSVVVVDGL